MSSCLPVSFTAPYWHHLAENQLLKQKLYRLPYLKSEIKKSGFVTKEKQLSNWLVCNPRKLCIYYLPWKKKKRSFSDVNMLGNLKRGGRSSWIIWVDPRELLESLQEGGWRRAGGSESGEEWRGGRREWDRGGEREGFKVTAPEWT